MAKTKTKVGKKKAEATVPTGRKPTGKPPKRIKMLMSLASADKAYTMGQCYDVPADVGADTARAWVGSKVAEKIS